MLSRVTASHPPTLCLKDGASGRWLRFRDVRHVVRCNTTDEVIDCLRDVEQWVARGYSAVGFVAYEAAAAFYADKESRPSSLPLVWFALCRSVITTDGPPSTATWPSFPWGSDTSEAEYRTQLGRIHDAIA